MMVCIMQEQYTWEYELELSQIIIDKNRKCYQYISAVCIYGHLQVVLLLFFYYHLHRFSCSLRRAGWEVHVGATNSEVALHIFLSGLLLLYWF